MLNKKILVSGGSGVIGSSICVKLAKYYDVCIGFNNSKKIALDVLNKCNQIRKGKHEIICLANLNEVINTNHNINNVDIFIHCAGFSDETKMSKIKVKQFQNQIDISLYALNNLSHKFIPHMIKNKFGRILFISSIGCLEGGTRQAHYAAGKAAGNSLIRSFGKEYGQYGITSNSLVVGLVKSPMLKKEIEDNSINSKLSKIPVKRMGSPEEIAHVCYMLCHELGGFINCQSINIDGGYLPT